MDEGKSQKEKPKKDIRRRHKRVLNLLQQQLEFYFGDANLRHDRFLRKKIESNKDGYVDLSMMLTFNKLNKLTTDLKLISKAVKNSKLLQLSDDEEKVRRTEKLPELKNTDDQTVYVDQLIAYCDHDWLKSVFSVCGTVDYISLPRYPNNGKIKGFAFIEFSTLEGAEKACQMFNNANSRKNKNKKRHSSSEGKLNEDKKEKRKRRRSSSFTETESESKISKKSRRRRSSSFSADVTSTDPLKKDSVVTFRETESNAKAGNKDVSSDTETQEFTKPSGKLKRKSKTEGEGKSNSKIETEGEGISKEIKKRRLKHKTELETEGKAENTRARESNVEISEISGTEAILSNEDDKLHEKKRKKSRKHRKRKDSDVKEIPLPPLYVIPKSEWLSLKQQYKTLQRKEMQKLKKTTRIIKSERVRLAELKASREGAKRETKDDAGSKHGDVREPNHDREIPPIKKSKKDRENNSLKKGNNESEPAKVKKEVKQLDMKPGTVMSIKTASDNLNKKDIKERLSKLVDVAYVDYTSGDPNGYVRFASEEMVEKIVQHPLEKFNFTLAKLTVNEEEEYFCKALQDQKKRYELNEKRSQRKKERGYMKTLRKASTAQSHIRFE